MKYIFVDTDNGGTPSNATPDTSTSKYHTSATWPANGARWSSLNSVFNDATCRGITDDLTIYCKGVAADTNGGSTFNMTCASLLVEGDLSGAAWDTSKYRIEYTSTGQAGLTITGANVGSATLRKLQILGNGTNASPATLLLSPTQTGLTHTVENCIVRQGSTARSSATSTSRGIFLSSTQSGLTLNIRNTIIYDIGSTSDVATYAFRQGNTTNAVTVNIYNSVISNVTRGGVGTSIGITCIAADTVTVKNCAVFGTGDDFQQCDTVAYCASDDGDGTNAVTGLTWANQFVDYVNGDFTLKSGSSLIGAGIGPSSDADVPTPDIAGVTRSGTTTDIGAAMFVPSGLTITSVTPSSFDSGIAGIVIAGAGFGASQGSSTVDIGGQAQTVTAWGDTSITITSARGSNSMGAGQLKVTIR